MSTPSNDTASRSGEQQDVSYSNTQTAVCFGPAIMGKQRRDLEEQWKSLLGPSSVNSSIICNSHHHPFIGISVDAFKCLSISSLHIAMHKMKQLQKLQQQQTIILHPAKTALLKSVTSIQQHRMKLLFSNPTRNKCAGLVNSSQRCFVNAILQALASLTSFRMHLQQSVWLLLLQQQESSLFVDSLLELLWQLHHGSATVLDGATILTHVASHYKQFRSSHHQQQQDAEEFMIALLDLVTKEINEKTFLLTTNNSTLQQHQQHQCDALSEVVRDSSVSFLSLSQQFMELSTTIVEKEEFIVESKTDFYHKSFVVEEEEKKSHDDDYHHEFTTTTLHNKNVNFIEEKERKSFYEEDYFPATTTIPNIVPNNPSLLFTRSSPFAGWLGSFLQCDTCYHARPVQNAPFLDLPIIPTSIVNLHNKRLCRNNRPSSSTCSPSSPFPKCSLEDALLNFTSMERVSCVSCRSCAIQQAKEIVSEEVLMLQQAISSIQKKKAKQNADTESLQTELDYFQGTLNCLNQMDPDVEEEEEDKNNTDNKSPFQIAANSLIAKQLKSNKREAFKRMLITRLPSVLCLHVQRRYYKASQNCMDKAMQLVDFPEILDVAPFTFFPESKILYRLMSVVEHIGNANFGHYVTYRRYKEEKWYRISDEHVQLVEWRDVKRCQAYLLFYEAQ